MKKTLGTVTTYHGNEHRYLRGHQVRIIAVIKNAAREDYDPDADDGPHLDLYAGGSPCSTKPSKTNCAATSLA